jgi:hypothetical protein
MRYSITAYPNARAAPATISVERSNEPSLPTVLNEAFPLADQQSFNKPLSIDRNDAFLVSFPKESTHIQQLRSQGAP